MNTTQNSFNPEDPATFDQGYRASIISYYRELVEEAEVAIVDRAVEGSLDAAEFAGLMEDINQQALWTSVHHWGLPYESIVKVVHS